MLTQSDRKRFAAALGELGIGLHEVFVAGHDNTLESFRTQWGRPKRVHRASNGVEVHVWVGLRLNKRSPVSNVFAADFGDQRAFHVVLDTRKAA